jgi:hypothetical protein
MNEYYPPKDSFNIVWFLGCVGSMMTVHWTGLWGVIAYLVCLVPLMFNSRWD